RDPRRPAPLSRHARPGLWLAGRNGREGCRARGPHRRGAGRSPCAPRRPLEGLGHHRGQRACRVRFPVRRAARRTRLRVRTLAPLAAGLGLVVASLAIARVPNLVEAPTTFLTLFSLAFVCYAVAVWHWRNAREIRVTIVVLGVAALSRLVLLPAAPTLSTDA